MVDITEYLQLMLVHIVDFIDKSSKWSKPVVGKQYNYLNRQTLTCSLPMLYVFSQYAHDKIAYIGVW